MSKLELHVPVDGARYYLPVRLGSKTVTVWVAENYCRYFARSELPDWLRQRLTMIMACDNKHLSTRDKMDYAVAPNGIVLRSVYESSKRECPEGFEDIGWRVNDKYFYVVTDSTCVDELKIGAERVTEKLR